MSRLILVRHGQASAGWGEDSDPGLDDLGRAQATEMADAVAPLGPMPIVVSPLRRTRETARPLEERWRATAHVEPRVGEIASPTDDLAEREVWLREVMRGGWSDVGDDLRRWREATLDALAGLKDDSVVVTHFVAINVAVGHALGDDRVACCFPDNGSRTVIDVDGGRFAVVELGAQVGHTRVT